MKKLYNITEKNKERVLLVVLDFRKQNRRWSAHETLEEMKELVVACDGEVTDSIICPMHQPTASYLISEGKVAEIVGLCGLKAFDTVVFSHDLKGSQQRNLEDRIRVKTIDRTQLILDIFARRATSREGKMQVELAQLEYLLPRLVGHGIELSRLGGGIGTLGPGETKLELDRRRIGQRITRLKKDLNDVAASRHLKRKQRIDKGVPSVTLVGYTNAGKSTLLNVLTQAKQTTKDGLFTTLDSVSRQYILPNHQKIILSDTVGFMHDLPHRLIEAFKATLEEVKEADVLLHVIDVSHPHFRHLYESVLGVLKELESLNKPIINIFNKIDQLADAAWLEDLKKNYNNAVCLSAKNGKNISDLLEIITQLLSSLYKEINVFIPIGRMDLVNLAHEEGEVYSIKYYNDKINIRASIPGHLIGKFTAAKRK